MSQRLSPAAKYHRQQARFWGRTIPQTLASIASTEKSLAWSRDYATRPDAPEWVAERIPNLEAILVIEERRLYANAVRAARAAGLALDNLWTR